MAILSTATSSKSSFRPIISTRVDKVVPCPGISKQYVVKKLVSGIVPSPNSSQLRSKEGPLFDP